MPDGLTFVNQSPHDLNFFLVQGQIDLRQFTELDVKTYCAPHFRFEARIIGQSHVLLFILGSTYFYEVFACCKDVALGDSAQIMKCGPLAQVVPTLRLELGNLAEYTFESRVTDLADALEDVRKLERQMASVKEPEYLPLKYEFPSNGSFHSPKTLIFAWIDTKNDKIYVRTVHTYEAHAVFTETEIEIFVSRELLLPGISLLSQN